MFDVAINKKYEALGIFYFQEILSQPYFGQVWG
jgi:hypothetical protein